MKEERDDILKEAFGYHNALVMYAYALLKDHARAEDAVQNAYVALSRRHETITGGSVLAWCRGTVRLEVLRLIRKNDRELSTSDSFLLDAAADAFEQIQTPDREAMRSEKLRRLQECFKELPDRSRILVSARYLDGLKLAELGEKSKMKKDAVRKSLYRIRQLLRECLERKSVSAR